MPYAKPILRWAGSKRQILPALSLFWSERFITYYEPFCGSLSLFLYLQPQNARLSDLNSDLIQTYITIRQYPKAITSILQTVECSSRSYYKIRSGFSNVSDPVERAAHFIYLNRLCFNGLYRTNTLGAFNVPYGGIKTPKIPDEEAILTFAESIKDANLSCQDFESALANVRHDDFVYLDPPYTVAATRTFREYCPKGFGFPDLERLRRCIEDIHAKGATFLLSYADTDEAARLARGFHCSYAYVNRLIAASSTNRQRVAELLISNQQLEGIKE